MPSTPGSICIAFGGAPYLTAVPCASASAEYHFAKLFRKR